MLLAASIHKISIVFLPIYFVYGIKSGMFLLLTLICILIGLKLSFSAVYYYFGDSIFGSYSTYLFTNKYEGSNLTESYIDLCFLLPFIFYAKRKIFEPGLDKLLFISMIMGFSISYTGTSLPLVGRLALFYTFSVIFLIPRTISYMKSSFIRCMFATVVLFFMYLAFFKDSNMYTYQLLF
jgi:hypothetical protein